MSFLSNQARVVYERFGSLTPLLFIIIVRKDCWLIKYKLYIERKRIEKWGKENQLLKEDDHVPRETRMQRTLSHLDIQ